MKDSVVAVQYSVNAGAGFVAIIPTRHATIVMQELIATGEHQPPNLRQLEKALFEWLRWSEETGSSSVIIADV